MEAQGVLYVRQKQWAVTYPGDTLDNGDKAGEDNSCNANTRKRILSKVIARGAAFSSIIFVVVI
jgi:hypothetical protein